MPRPKDYARENTQHGRSSKVMKKTSLPTQYRTLKKQCSQCSRKDAVKYPVSIKEVRWLCPDCIAKYLRRDDKEVPNFIKASVLNRG